MTSRTDLLSWLPPPDVLVAPGLRAYSATAMLAIAEAMFSSALKLAAEECAAVAEEPGNEGVTYGRELCGAAIEALALEGEKPAPRIVLAS
jgi:hypothetical protein